jgi:dephospho-CoA kinase
VLAPDGSLDRAALARIVFADPAALARLEAIVHPEVGRLARAAEAAAPDGSVVVQDRPLLVERATRETFDVVVVVDCDPGTQVRRLIEDRGMTEDEARARMAAQASRDSRLAVADEVVGNDGTLAELDAATDALWQRLLARARQVQP